MKRRAFIRELEAAGCEMRIVPGARGGVSLDGVLSDLGGRGMTNVMVEGGGRVLGAFDRNVVDGGVNGAGWLTRFSSSVSIWWDTWIIDGAVRLSSLLVKLSSYPVRIVQTGRVQAYALFVVVGALAFFGYYLAR